MNTRKQFVAAWHSLDMADITRQFGATENGLSEPNDGDNLERKPRSPQARIFSRLMFKGTIATAL
jgi:hypothetical protein